VIIQNAEQLKMDLQISLGQLRERAQYTEQAWTPESSMYDHGHYNEGMNATFNFAPPY